MRQNAPSKPTEADQTTLGREWLACHLDLDSFDWLQVGTYVLQLQYPSPPSSRRSGTKPCSLSEVYRNLYSSVVLRYHILCDYFNDLLRLPMTSFIRMGRSRILSLNIISSPLADSRLYCWSL